MPAYRSNAEAEIRIAVVERLRAMIPGCRIIHEINAESFGNRIDVLAVGEDRIAAVEIKSAKDKLDRLPDQVKAMRQVTSFVYAALHEKFLSNTGSGFYPPDKARGAVTWVYPKAERSGYVDCGTEWHEVSGWNKPARCLPHDAIHVLWREELHNVCRSLGIKSVAKLTMGEAIDQIRWRMTGEQITKLICATLRARNCVEADPPIAAGIASSSSVTPSWGFGTSQSVSL
ncbi:NERD domain-containing protein [Rhizobium sp. CFBP 8762]|uniref:NERD domain-containing protein n=1 Tax=Rhizobium sp. CFBP 8762 TaxID=2775279 RepID=UPI00177E84A1|nr:NERD domain-containing protein [Rhizobium sp. CFBP 8762]MBD8555536.1 NERD domain-containing protein [Rhizobium sp. CFBP 8762]